MASLIEGFNYDIFISYRQKDNKYDGWVTEFFDNLKKELEATFKEEISVYFDINPYDGLLETHDVDASIKDKLKCLVFIPIISRTYCDPKSFAWEHEFKAFVEQASNDQFGLKIKLPNGNFANRVLPIRIYDLENTDIKLCESVLGGLVRGIEFIYKSAGVNRPLTPSDYPEKNQYKTFYRDQINKVANAIKENISGLKGEPLEFGSEPKDVIKMTLPEEKARNKTKKVLIYSLSLLVILAVVFVTIKTNFLNKEIEKSIAVLPFRNDSPEDSTEYFMNGVMDELLTRLQLIKELRVISRTSIEQYREINKTIPEIANELDVNYIVEGSGQKIGKSFRMRVQLIRAKKESHLWANNFEQQILTMAEYFKAQSGFVEDIANQLQAAISPKEKKLIEKLPTADMTAYEAYLKGQYYYRKVTPNDLDTAMQYFELAKDKDSEFALAHAFIGSVWISRQVMGLATPDEGGPKAMGAINKALELDSTIAEVHYTLALMNTFGLWDWKSADSEFKKAISINPNYADAHTLYSLLLNILGQPEEAMEHIELALKLDPHNPMIDATYNQDLLYVHRYDDVISASRALFDKNPTMFLALDPLINALYLTGRYEEGFEAMRLYFCNYYKDFNHVFDQYAKLGYTGTLNLEGDTLLAQSKTKFIVPIDIAYLYLFAGNKERVLDCLEQSYELHDNNIPIITRPTYDILHNEPRFQAICRKMNLSCNN